MAFVGSAIAGVALGAVGGGLLGGMFAPDAPDMSGSNAAAQANAATAARAQDLAERQYADQKALLDQNSPMFRDQIQKAITAQDLSNQQSAAQWGQYQQYFQPLEQKLATEAASYNTPARQEQEAQQAAADTAAAFDTQRADMRRGLESYGGMPGTGRMQALENASRIEEAKAIGGAKSQARRTVEQQGMAYLDNAARFGRNMPSTGLATATLAGQQGQQAQAAFGGLQQATAAPTQYAAPMFNTSITGNNSAGSLFQGNQNLAFQANQARGNQIMGGIGGGLQLAGMFLSSEELKDIAGEVDPDAAVTAVMQSPAKAWTYKGDSLMRLGPTAESLADATGMGDGTMIDGISLMGLHHAAIAGLARDVQEMKKAGGRLALADARRND